MNRIKLIELLKTLDNREFKAFQKYVAASPLAVSKKVPALLTALANHHPGYHVTVVDLRSMVKGNSKTGLKEVRYLMTDLTRLLEGYFIYREMQGDDALQERLLLRAFQRRNAQTYFMQLIKEANKRQEALPYRDHAYFENSFKLNELAYEFAAVNDNRSAANNLQDVTHQLDYFYAGRQLKYACEMLNRSNILKTTYVQPFLQQLLNYLFKNPVPAVPAIEVYLQVYKTIASPEDERNFDVLKKVIHKNFEKFPVHELRDIYAFAQNYCIRKVNTGQTQYLRELFTIYNFLLEKKIIFDHGVLSHAEFKNICAIALRCDELQWTAHFIEKYANYLRKDLRKNSVSYNMARLHFSKQEYRAALKLLTDVEFTDVYYHLDAKSLLVKVYYETSEIEPLYSLFSSFRIYLKRSRLISDYQRTIYLNQIRFVKKLIKIKPRSRQAIDKLRTEIDANKQVADYGWLLEKIMELA